MVYRFLAVVQVKFPGRSIYCPFSLLEFSPLIHSRTFDSLHKHREELSDMGFYTIVFVGTLTVTDQLKLADDIFAAFWGDSAINVLLLVSDEQRTTLYTYFIYSNETCGNPQTVAYNYYWHATPEVEEVEGSAQGTDELAKDSDTLTGFEFNRPMFPKKCHHLYNCPVYVTTFNIAPFMILKTLENGTLYYDGIEGIVLRVLSQRLHFRPILVKPEDQERWGACSDASTELNCTGALKVVSCGFY